MKHIGLDEEGIPCLTDDTNVKTEEKKSGETKNDEAIKVKGSFVQNTSIPDEVSQFYKFTKKFERFLNSPYKKLATVIINSDEDEDKVEAEQEKRWEDERRLKSSSDPYGSLPEYKLKADISNFHGGLQIEELLDWFYEVESFFNFMDVPDSSKVKLVAYKLKGGAAAWWDKLCDDRNKYLKPPIRTWKRMRDLLRDRF
ncbi:uncharacterized protein LOC113316772 [Papaver somniferum]|uniref:uncharacterized protein LOC113316772 n=1 Tax=Papaver somniferum TaxID=3469 RepID=UPI000E6FE300|nr:uncharacterized protein LOC113316772 [Papaver somniferum]